MPAWPSFVMRYSGLLHRVGWGASGVPSVGGGLGVSINNSPAYILIKPWTHKVNVIDPKSEKKQKLGSCFWMQAEHGRETPPGYEVNLNLRNYLPD